MIMQIVGDLLKIIADVLAGREGKPAKRVREVWASNRSALAKAEADDRAAKKFGDQSDQ